MRLRLIILESDADDRFNMVIDDAENDAQEAYEEMSLKSNFKTPDDAYKHGCITFIYGGKPPALYIDETMHSRMLDRNNWELLRELVKNTMLEKKVGDKSIEWHSIAQKFALLGRVSPGGDYVSIWNYDREQIDRLYPEVLEQLWNDDIVRNDTVVYALTYDEPYTVEQIVDGDSQSNRLSPEQEKQLEAMRQMHLARGDEKKNLMKQAGLKTLPGKRHPMAAAMQKVGKSSPGQKWWTASEGRHK